MDICKKCGIGDMVWNGFIGKCDTCGFVLDVTDETTYLERVERADVVVLYVSPSSLSHAISVPIAKEVARDLIKSYAKSMLAIETPARLEIEIF